MAPDKSGRRLEMKGGEGQPSKSEAGDINQMESKNRLQRRTKRQSQAYRDGDGERYAKIDKSRHSTPADSCTEADRQTDGLTRSRIL